jgi:ribonuclease HI
MTGGRHAALLRRLALAAREGRSAWLPDGVLPEEAAAALEAGAVALGSAAAGRMKRTGRGLPGRRPGEVLGPPEVPGPVKAVRIHVDGASRGNPGPAGFGAILEPLPDGPPVAHSAYLGETTNNVAEYQALLWALGEARRRGFDVVEVRSDSELMVRQMRGEYRVKQPHLQALHAQATRAASGFRHFSIRHLPRQENAAADRLANRAIEEGRAGWATPRRAERGPE